MSGNRMHPDELDIDEPLVRRLVAAECPQWADLPLAAVRSAGTDNALFRLGAELVVRLPRIQGAASGVEKEARWLPRLAPLLPTSIPVPVAVGAPAEGYPWKWGIYRWIEGDNPTPAQFANFDTLTHELTEFVGALHHVDLPGGPLADRGAPLEVQDDDARTALAQLDALIDTEAALSAWDQALATPAWSEAPVWIHGDLLPGNLLVRGSHLSGVIDWAGVGIGDPACDLAPAWALLPRRSRDDFRASLGVDDATWARGRGWALSIGVIALPYYRNTNPSFGAVAHHLIREVLADHRGEA